MYKYYLNRANVNLFLWRHFDINSVRLFKIIKGSALIIDNFLVRQKLISKLKCPKTLTFAHVYKPFRVSRKIYWTSFYISNIKLSVWKAAGAVTFLSLNLIYSVIAHFQSILSLKVTHCMWVRDNAIKLYHL